MINRKLDEDGDYIFGRGSSELLSGTDAVSQAIYTRLWLWQEQWWENQLLGLPMLQQILTYRNSTPAADLLIRDRILNTTGVTAIVSFDSSFDEKKRAYNCSAVVNTKYGKTATGVTI